MVRMSINIERGNTLLCRMSEMIFSVFHHTGNVLCNAYNVTAKTFEFMLRFSVERDTHKVSSLKTSFDILGNGFLTES